MTTQAPEYFSVRLSFTSVIINAVAIGLYCDLLWFVLISFFHTFSFVQWQFTNSLGLRWLLRIESRLVLSYTAISQVLLVSTNHFRMDKVCLSLVGMVYKQLSESSHIRTPHGQVHYKCCSDN